MDALLIFGMFFAILTAKCTGFTGEIDMYNMDGSMNTTPYVVHIGTKKLQLQKNLKLYVGFALGFAGGGREFYPVKDGL